jgi:hypothetical protein
MPSVNDRWNCLPANNTWESANPQFFITREARSEAVLKFSFGAIYELRKSHRGNLSREVRDWRIRTIRAARGIT